MFDDETVTKTYKVILTILSFGAALFIAYRLRTVIFWLAIGAFLAIIMNPAVDRIIAYMPGKRRGLATGVVVLLLIIFWMALGWLFVPPLIRQVTALIDNWPRLTNDLIQNLRHADKGFYVLLRRHGAVNYIQAHQGQIEAALSSFFIKSLQGAGSTLSSIGAVFTIFAMAVYMSIHGPTYVAGIRARLPRKYHRDIELLSGRMYAAVTGYVNGNLLTSGIAALTSGVVAFIAGLPFPTLLALIVGLADLIPMVGGTLGALIVITVALFTSVKAAVVIAVFFLVYQQFENYILQPKVMSRTVKMSSFAVFVSAICGGVLAGILGALLAIPAGACIQIIIQHYFPVDTPETYGGKKLRN
jgi:predicted PurR-regulated permease PerM